PLRAPLAREDADRALEGGPGARDRAVGPGSLPDAGAARAERLPGLRLSCGPFRLHFRGPAGGRDARRRAQPEHAPRGHGLRARRRAPPRARSSPRLERPAVNVWLIGATALLAGLVPCGWVLLRGRLTEAIVGVELASAIVTVVLVLLAAGLH